VDEQQASGLPSRQASARLTLRVRHPGELHSMRSWHRCSSSSRGTLHLLQGVSRPRAERPPRPKPRRARARLSDGPEGDWSSAKNDPPRSPLTRHTDTPRGRASNRKSPRLRPPADAGPRGLPDVTLRVRAGGPVPVRRKRTQGSAIVAKPPGRPTGVGAQPRGFARATLMRTETLDSGRAPAPRRLPMWRYGYRAEAWPRIGHLKKALEVVDRRQVRERQPGRGAH
jgi:hypothetical protein